MSNILVVGRRGEGKTTLALYLLRQRHTGVLAWDPRGMIDGYVVTSIDELEDALEEREWQRQTIVYRPAMQDLDEEFAALCDFLFPPGDAQRWRAFGLLVDEAGDLQTFASIHPSIKRAIAQHYNKDTSQLVTIIQTSHRLPEFHGKSKALMDELYIFATTHPRDLDTLTDYTGDPQVAEIVRTLPKHHCIRYKFARQADGPQYEVWSEPERWFVPLESTVVPDEPQKRSFMDLVRRK